MTGKRIYPEEMSLDWRRKYSRAKAQAKFRNEEWAFTAESWYALWADSDLIQHRGKQNHNYCMVRKDNIEAWGPHNCILVSRRQYFRKQAYETMLKKIPVTEWKDKHDVRNKNGKE